MTYYTLSIPLTVSKKARNTCRQSIPQKGSISFVRFSFPNSKNTVRARLYINGNQVIPAYGGELMDNNSVDIPLGYDVNEGDEVVLEVQNRDELSNHTVVATLSVESQPETENEVMYAPSQEVFGYGNYGPNQATIEPVPPEQLAQEPEPRPPPEPPIPLEPPQPQMVPRIVPRPPTRGFTFPAPLQEENGFLQRRTNKVEIESAHLILLVLIVGLLLILMLVVAQRGQRK